MDFKIHPLADVQSNNIGSNTYIWQFSVVLPGAIIGSNCNINCNVFIENNVIIGDNVTIKAGVQLWDGIQIEDSVFVGPNVTFTNDNVPRSRSTEWQLRHTTIRRNASIGGNCTILPGIEIGEYALLGAGSVLTKNMPPFTVWFGNPAVHTGYITDKGSLLSLDLEDKNTKEKYKIINGKPTK